MSLRAVTLKSIFDRAIYFIKKNISVNDKPRVWFPDERRLTNTKTPLDRAETHIFDIHEHLNPKLDAILLGGMLLPIICSHIQREKGRWRMYLIYHDIDEMADSGFIEFQYWEDEQLN